LDDPLKYLPLSRFFGVLDAGAAEALEQERHPVDVPAAQDGEESFAGCHVRNLLHGPNNLVGNRSVGMQKRECRVSNVMT
jgi:hypothetical protein